jgi:NADH:ubiquinone oxidoreductase subunit F (NADH-binding)/NADH:ubiquinone oxidoreductase subunit E
LSEIVRELLRLQEEEGWLSPASLEALASRLRLPLHRLESVSTFYTHFKREAPRGVEVEVCRDLSCQLAGLDRANSRGDGQSVQGQLCSWAEKHGGAEIREVSCLGRCDQAPAAAIGDRILDASNLESIAEAVETGSREALARPARAWPAVDPYAVEESPGRPREAYRILRSVLEGSPEKPIEALESAGLRGMGGAGFPTARKWSLVAAEKGSPKHVVCNADESEPGTFKDRELLFDLPHLVIEGLVIAGYCVGAERGTVFIRHEYGPERERVEAAIEEARAAGALGQNIFGADFSFEVEVFVSPGGYILGEETALLECMEGRRGEPRNKPPFPGNVGLHGRPTLINNVETLVHAVSIVSKGADWWHSLGLEGFSGHKFISVSGDVVDPGVSLFPVGTRLSEVLETHGGIKHGADILAVAPGGASSNFLGPEALDLPLDFDALAEAGTMLGSGAAVFVAEGEDLLAIGLSITRFFRNESCGKCVPCRVGSEKAVALVERAQNGNAGLDEAGEALLRSLHETMQQTSICGLGQVALGPLLSIISRFPDRIRRAESN